MKSQHSTGPPIKVSHDRAYSVTYKERRKDKKQEVNGIVKFSGCIYFVGCMYSCFGRLHVFYVLSFRKPVTSTARPNTTALWRMEQRTARNRGQSFPKLFHRLASKKSRHSRPKKRRKTVAIIPHQVAKSKGRGIGFHLLPCWCFLLGVLSLFLSKLLSFTKLA